jgi:hypothetical protein
MPAATEYLLLLLLIPSRRKGNLVQTMDSTLFEEEESQQH